MGRIFDLADHPNSDGGRQRFRLLLEEVDDLTPDDLLRLTVKATGEVSFWRASPASDTGRLELINGGWRGVLTQVDPSAG